MKLIRNLSHIPPDLLESKLHAQPLAIPPSLNTNELTEQYNRAVAATLDLLAPLKLKKQRNIPSKSWFNTDLNIERRRLRLTERLWRQHPSPSNLANLRLARSSSKKHIFRQKTSFLRSQLDRAQNRPRELFNIVRNQTASAPPVPLASKTRCEEIALFFSDKIRLIEQYFLSTAIPTTNPNTSLNIPPSIRTPPTPSTAHHNSDLPYPSLPPNFQDSNHPNSLTKNNAAWLNFQPVTERDVFNIISKLKPSSHTKDPLPSKLVQNLKHIITPTWTSIINSSLATGCVPNSLQLGQITPIIKNPLADPNDLNNLRPISNLPLLSKALEKCVLLQL
ncbi:uncharacterized protein LOC144822929 [Lissotriton helveticus]